MNKIIGKPVDRVDGRLKVTGGATYSAEFNIKDIAYGVTVQSTISKGRINHIQTNEAERAAGVIAVITYRNAMMLHQPDSNGGGKYAEKDLLPLQSDRIHYDGQHIAIVLAETFEQAEYAAGLIKVTYDEAKPTVAAGAEMGEVYKPSESMGRKIQMKRGDVANGLNEAAVQISHTYTTPVFHHNPMEPHATIAQWDGDRLTVYDSTQGVVGTKMLLAQMLGLHPDKVQVISYFIGGGFGCKGFMWPHTVMTAIAAKKIGRPVKIVLSRQQMFTCNGRRAKTVQHISLGADNRGKLTGINHDSINETSFVDEFTETCGLATSMLYSSPNMNVSHSLVRLNRVTPTPMRAPGEAPGTFALECAMDELAHELNMDPVQLRLVNYAETDEQKKKPYSSKNLKECYERGAAAIGWSNRSSKPGTQKEGKYLVGYGMATGTYPANRSPASAKVTFFDNGKVIAECATQDIGTGTYTIMTQTVAEALGMPIHEIKFKLGDSALPKGPGSGGSQSAASVGPAVRAASLGVRSKFIKLATADKHSPLNGYTEEDIDAADGRLYLKMAPDKGEHYTDILKRHGLSQLQEEASTNVSTRDTKGGGDNDDEKKEENKAAKEDEAVDRGKYSFHSFSAVFAKVLVDPDLGTIHVDKCVGVMDIGTVLNLKTAKNQIMGGMIFALGMALMEETAYDPNNGRVVTHDLAQYLVPVHADMPVFDIQFIDKPDPYISPIGARGIGEIGITGTAAAIVNAIYNATGKRVRDLPVTPDKLI